MRYIFQWLRQQTIEKKLIFLNLVGISLAFIPVIIILVSYEYFALRNHLFEETQIKATIVGESAAAAMAFHDESAANESLATLKGAKDVLEAHLILPDGTLLQSYGKKKEFSFIPVKATNVEKESFSYSFITVEKPIYLRNEFVGSIKLVNTLDSFYYRLMLYGLIIIVSTTLGFLLARWIATCISKTITDPLITLLNATKKVMKEEDYTTPVAIYSQDEVGSLSLSFNRMMSQIHSKDLSLKNLAFFDRVTGIANRHFFEEQINKMVKNAQQYNITCYLMMIDLDDFKIVNDTLGHHIGDLLLKHVSGQLSQSLRQDDAISRIGGDEFAVLLDNLYDNEAVEQIAIKIIQAISTPVILEGHEVKVGASIGISCFPRFASDVKTLMSTADIAMYEAKRNGKNSFKVYDGDK